MPRSIVVWGLAAGLAYGLGAAEVRRFERAAAEDIRAKLGGAEAQVRVRSEFSGILGALGGDLRFAEIQASNFTAEELPLFTEPERSTRGRVKELRIALRNFRLQKLEVESLEASIPDCRYDLGLAARKRQIRLSRSGVGLGTVRISEKALEKFILAKFGEIKSVSVRCDRGWVWVEGYGEFVVLATNFRVLAKLEPATGTQLSLTRARVSFDGLPADPLAAEALLATLNPVVDLDRDLGLHGAIRVTSVETSGGTLTASGETTIPARPDEPRENLRVVL